MAEGTQVAFNNVDMMDAVLNGQDVTFTPRTDQFGTQVFSFEVKVPSARSPWVNSTVMNLERSCKVAALSKVCVG